MNALKQMEKAENIGDHSSYEYGRYAHQPTQPFNI